MSRTIRIDDDVFKKLQALAVPLVDSPNDVIRRLLNIAEPVPDASVSAESPPPKPARREQPAVQRRSQSKRTRRKRTRAASGSLLPESDYERPILETILQAGGTAPARVVIDAVGVALEDRLLPADREKLASGSIRWANRVQFVRLRLVQAGALEKNAPRGTWTLTDHGREYLEELRNRSEE